MYNPLLFLTLLIPQLLQAGQSCRGRKKKAILEISLKRLAKRVMGIEPT
jgi:hypothetical protein